MSPTFAERILLVHGALDDHGIGHGFGGAVALAYYVLEPRATRDIDLNIVAGVERAGPVLAALPPGIEVGPGAVEAVGRDGQVRLWWDGPGGIPVDLFFPQHELHDHVAADIRPVPFLDTTIPVISATHLTVFKALFNRSRDWPDIEAMLGAGAVDTTAALGWVARLVGPGSPQYEKLAALVEGAGPSGAAGSDDVGLPRVDWDSLGD